MPAILDTGNDSPIILPLSFVDKLHLAAAPIPVGYAVSAAGRQPILAARLAGTVRMGSVTIDQPKIYFMQGGRPNIGLPVLRQIKVIYDPSGAGAWIASTATITAQ